LKSISIRVVSFAVLIRKKQIPFGNDRKKPQISPLRFAPVEMTKSGVIANLAFLVSAYKKQIPFGNDRKKGAAAP
jgi:hypothetical protein